MSDLEHQPQAPHTMEGYTDEERAIARDLQSRSGESFVRKHRKGISRAAIGIVLGAGSFLGVKSTFTDSIDNTLNGKNTPGASAPEVPGEAEGSTEKVSGISLNSEQRAALESGDIAAQYAMYDELLIDPLAAAVNAYTTGETPTLDLSGLSSDPEAAEWLTAFADQAVEKAEQTGNNPGMWICYTNPETAVDGACAENESEFDTEKMSLAYQVISGDSSIEVPKRNHYGKQNVPVVPKVVGDSLTLVSVESFE